MLLRATVSIDELRKLLDQLVPLRIHLQLAPGAKVAPQRWVELRDPTDTALVPGKGLRVVCSGAVRYDVGPIHAKVRIHQIALVLVPAVTHHADGTRGLELTLEVEKADTAMPDGLDALLIAGINELMEPNAKHGVWRIEHAMKAKLPLPPHLVPLEAFHIGASWTGVEVRERDFDVMLDLDAGITRTAEGLPTVEEVAAERAAEDAEAEHALRDPKVPKGYVNSAGGES